MSKEKIGQSWYPSRCGEAYLEVLGELFVSIQEKGNVVSYAFLIEDKRFTHLDRFITHVENRLLLVLDPGVTYISCLFVRDEDIYVPP